MHSYRSHQIWIPLQDRRPIHGSCGCAIINDSCCVLLVDSLALSRSLIPIKSQVRVKCYTIIDIEESTVSQIMGFVSYPDYRQLFVHIGEIYLRTKTVFAKTKSVVLVFQLKFQNNSGLANVDKK